MKRRTTLGLVLVGGMLVAGLVTPARAAPATEADSTHLKGSVPIAVPLARGQTPQLTCEVEGGSAFPPFNHLYDYWVVGRASYEDVPGNPMFRQWTMFRFHIDGIPLTGDHSNVNIRVREGGALRWERKSPDDISPDVDEYIAVPSPSSPVYTSTSGVDDVVEFEAIFDRSWGSDPRCTTSSPPV